MSDATPSPTPTVFATREAWLGAAIEAVRPIFTDAGAPLPERIRVSVGFGYNGAAENKHILAQAWASVTSHDGIPAVFISPIIADAVDALCALLHELNHTSDDCASGHGKAFKATGEAIGLEGKPTQMLPGVALSAVLITVAETLGAYPHSALDPHATRVPVGPASDEQAPAGRVRTGPATQTNRHLAAVCMNDACAAKGYTVRTSRKWLEIATPICPVCLTTMNVA